MLVLTRNVDEGIWIGDDIRIVVVRVDNGRVRVGIVAPSDKQIDRDEIRDRKKTEGVLRQRLEVRPA